MPLDVVVSPKTNSDRARADAWTSGLKWPECRGPARIARQQRLLPCRSDLDEARTSFRCRRKGSGAAWPRVARLGAARRACEAAASTAPQRKGTGRQVGYG